MNSSFRSYMRSMGEVYFKLAVAVYLLVYLGVYMSTQICPLYFKAALFTLIYIYIYIYIYRVREKN